MHLSSIYLGTKLHQFCTGLVAVIPGVFICSLALYQNSIHRFLPDIAEYACTIPRINN